MFGSKACVLCPQKDTHYTKISTLYLERIADLKEQITFLQKQLLPPEVTTPVTQEANFIFSGAGESAPEPANPQRPEELSLDDQELLSIVPIMGNMGYQPKHSRNS